MLTLSGSGAWRKRGREVERERVCVCVCVSEQVRTKSAKTEGNKGKADWSMGGDVHKQKPIQTAQTCELPLPCQKKGFTSTGVPPLGSI